MWNTLGTLPNLLPDSSKSSFSTIKSAISNSTIEVQDADFNMQTLSRDTKDRLNKLDEIFDKKKIEERQELSKLFAKEAFGQLHNWNPTSKEGKAAKAIDHGVVAEVSARMAGNKPGSCEVGVNVTNIYNSIVGDKSEEDKAYNEVSDLLKNYGG